MLEFIVGKPYIVGHAVTGLFIGRFTGTDKDGALQFADVTEIVDVAMGSVYTVSPTGIVDAEQWRQAMEIVNYAEVSAAANVAINLSRRKVVNVERCTPNFDSE